MSDDGAERLGEGRLARWSRLKRETRTRGGADPVAAVAEQSHPPDQVAALAPEGEHLVARKAPGEERQPAELPPIDSLDKNSDYTPFLKEGVPEDLKRQALRKLWSSDPAFMETDPYNVYNDDFTKFIPIDAAKDTSYKIGRGFCEPEDLMTDEEKEAARRAREAASAPTADETQAALPAGTGEPAPGPDSRGGKGEIAATEPAELAATIPPDCIEGLPRAEPGAARVDASMTAASERSGTEKPNSNS